MFRRENMTLHFVGIGGIGMSGIAEVFLNQGYHVTGSDVQESETTQRLSSLGIEISIGHRAQNVHGASVVVVSSAIRANNPEIRQAKEERIPVIPRAEMLGELMRGKFGIAVAGTHGKTTTTSILATILTHAGLDPTLVIGGKVDSLGGNAKLGKGSYVVAEADESDGSFFHLPAMLSIVTNIDQDHLDHFGSLGAIEDAFVQFISKIPFYGMSVLCGEDEGVRRCLPRLTKPYLTYGFSSEWNLFADQIEEQSFGTQFRVCFRPSASEQAQSLGILILPIPGRHNILNALAAVAISLELELPFDVIAKGLKNFGGVKRRFDLKWKNAQTNQAIIDDYAHHPVEIRATLEAARSYWRGRIVSVFQPHRFSRTKACWDDFLSAFEKSDVVCITDIFPASEDPIAGITSSELVRAMQAYWKDKGGKSIHDVGSLEEAERFIGGEFQPGDLVLCLGAGSITRLATRLVPLSGGAKEVRSENSLLR